MLNFSRIALLSIALFALASSASASAAAETGFIYGTADAGAQIVVIGVDSGQIVGVVAKPDGTYRTDGLAPGRYRIAEKGAYHAPRELSVSAGKSSNVDLRPTGTGQ